MLTRRRASATITYPEAWVVQTTTKINGRNVVPGTALKIRGERGTFRFVKHVLNTGNGAEWIDVVGGAAGSEACRSFRPERVKTVHRGI